MTRLGIVGATGWLGSALGRGVPEAGLVRASGLVLPNRSGARADRQGRRDATWASDVADRVLVLLATTGVEPRRRGRP